MNIEQYINDDVPDFDSADLGQVDFNLSLTPEQRILYHQSALDLIFALRQARTPHEAKLERSIESIPRVKY
jgi:hypothetical protein